MTFPDPANFTFWQKVAITLAILFWPITLIVLMNDATLGGDD